jgi:hypothetical protein
MEVTFIDAVPVLEMVTCWAAEAWPTWTEPNASEAGAKERRGAGVLTVPSNLNAKSCVDKCHQITSWTDVQTVGWVCDTSSVHMNWPTESFVVREMFLP